MIVLLNLFNYSFIGAIAERLWSANIPLDLHTAEQARSRLDAMRCRLLRYAN